KAHKLFCLSLRDRFPDYSENLWGISASDYVKGYTAWGGPNAQGGPIGPVDGSIVPCATGGSLGFLFDDSIRVLRNLRGPYREKVWTKYSFRDAFNPLTNWYDGDVDRKSTRLNSSHVAISYAVFCLKKKKTRKV